VVVEVPGLHFAVRFHDVPHGRQEESERMLCDDPTKRPC
jgi:hypothetical protein